MKAIRGDVYLSLLPALAAAGLWAQPAAAQERASQEAQVEEILVTAERREQNVQEVPISMIALTGETLQERGIRTLDELQYNVPSLTFSDNGNSKFVNIRGVGNSESAPNQTNGVAVHLDGGYIAREFLYGDAFFDVENVLVLRGPQGFIYGADAGGVVQIVTRRAQSGMEGQIGLEGGRYGAQKMNAYIAGGNETFDAFLSAADWQTDGFNSMVDDQDGDADGYANTTLHGKFGWNPSQDLRVQVVLRDVKGDNQHDNCYDQSFQQIHDCTSLLEQTTGRISLDHSAGSIAHHVAFSHSAMERDNFSRDYLAFGTKGALKKLEYVGRVNASDGVAVVFGGDAKTERVHVVDGDDLSRYQLGMFSEFQLGLDDRLFFTGGLRYDENEDFGEHVSARLTSAYIMPAGREGALKLRASAGNGFRAPSLYEVTTNRNAQAPMADLKEESSSGYDIGVEYYRDSGVSAQLTWFEQSIEDEIVYDMQNWAYKQADGRSHSKGAELQLTLPVSTWARLDTVFTRNLTQTADDLPRVHRPGKSANLSLYLYPAEGLVILVNNRWESGVLDVARTPLDAYQVLDISATYTLVPGWDIFGRVENALDEVYQEVRGYYTLRRAAYLGTRFTF